jgi:phospholipid/cholesterol/gamma-HCH transport system ATP-binding protein
MADPNRMSAAKSDPVISFEDVHLDMGEGDLLHGVTFGVVRGETKVLIGETGSGKTLVLKLAAGLIKPTRGHVHVLGRDLGAMSESELLTFRRQIGFVFQEGALFDSMSVADNVAYRLNEEGVDPGEIDSRVREVLRFVEMEDSLDQFPADLSGGMRRRVSIARALVTNPHVVLYDSPTAGLDPLTSQTIIMFIMRLRDTEHGTSLLATHRLQDAFGLANYRFDPIQGRVIKDPAGHLPAQGGVQDGRPSTNFLVLRDGQVYFEGSTQAVLETSDAYLKQFLE